MYAFKGGGGGANPQASLIKVGNALYGTSYDGGGSPNCQDGCGTVFSVNPTTGAEAVVYAFKGGSDGSGLVSGLFNVGGTLYQPLLSSTHRHTPHRNVMAGRLRHPRPCAGGPATHSPTGGGAGLGRATRGHSGQVDVERPVDPRVAAERGHGRRQPQAVRWVAGTDARL